MFRKLFGRSRRDSKIATQPVVEVFPWPKGVVLKPLDRLVFSLPVAMINEGETIGSVIDCDNNAGIAIPDGDDKIYLRVEPGVKVRLSKSVQAVVLGWSEDEVEPKRIEIIDAPLDT